MKRLTGLIVLTSVLAVSCSYSPEVTFEVSNPLDNQRNDATLLLTRTQIEEEVNVPAGKVPLLSDETGNPLPCQWDDVDGDGKWDELFTLLDMGPSSQSTLILSFIIPEDYPAFDVRTNLRLGGSEPGYPELSEAARLEGVSYHNFSGRTGAAFQMEGPAWESDRVGFRNYMDQRNGMDIFGKTTTAMVLDSVGMEGRPSYHEPADWGMDVLKVGSSLGAGAIAYWYKDSLYRVGDNGSGTYKAVAEGSQRSIFDLSYQGWEVDGIPVNVNHQILITGGCRYYQSSVTHSGADLPLSLVPGIVNMKSDTLHVFELNESYTCLMTHDHQSEDATMLTMALMVQTNRLKSYGEAKEQGEGVTQTYYAVLDTKSGIAVPYRFYALWEKEDPSWANLEEVKAFLKSEADSWTQALQISFQP